MRPLRQSPAVNRLGRLSCRLFAVGLSIAIAAPAVRAAQPEIVNPRRTPIVDVVERVKGAVVNIQSERTVTGRATDDTFPLSPQPHRVNGMGTGIIVDPRGFIVTNHHVIEDVSVIRARLADGTTYPARVLARDPETDLALLKIEPLKPLPTMPLGTAGDLMVGETVIAIGNAFGYEHTVTVGIVSAIKRDVTLSKEMSYKSLIQTDASINPGNSGGPLVNVHGELIGVNVAIRANAQGIGFAIPVDQMIRVTSDMMGGRRKTALGIVIADRVEPNSSPAKRTVVIDRGDNARGMQVGDVLTKVADVPVSNTLEVERVLLDRPVGEQVPITVRRGEAEQVVQMSLTAADRGPAPSGDLIWKKLGVRVAPVSADAVARFNAQLHGGLTVVDLQPEGAAAKAGIQRGDILIGLHQWETIAPENITFVLSHPDLNSFSPVRFFVLRGGQVRRGHIPQVQ